MSFVRAIGLAVLGAVLSHDPGVVFSGEKDQKAEKPGIISNEPKLPRAAKETEDALVWEIVNHRAHYTQQILSSLSKKLKADSLPKDVDLNKVIKLIDQKQSELSRRLSATSLPESDIQELHNFIGELVQAEKLFQTLLPKINPEKLNFDEPDNYWLLSYMQGFINSNGRAISLREHLLRQIERGPEYLPHYGFTKARLEVLKLTELNKDKGVHPLLRWVDQAEATVERQKEQWHRDIRRLHNLDGKKK